MIYFENDLARWRASRGRNKPQSPLEQTLKRSGLALDTNEGCIDREDREMHARVGFVLACPKCGSKLQNRAGFTDSCGEANGCFEASHHLGCATCGTAWAFSLSTNECGNTELSATVHGDNK